MAVRMSLDERIDKAEAAVAAAKKKYDDALDELEKLVAKRKELDDKKVLKALQMSSRILHRDGKIILPRTRHIIPVRKQQMRS